MRKWATTSPVPCDQERPAGAIFEAIGACPVHDHCTSRAQGFHALGLQPGAGHLGIHDDRRGRVQAGQRVIRDITVDRDAGRRRLAGPGHPPHHVEASVRPGPRDRRPCPVEEHGQTVAVVGVAGSHVQDGPRGRLLAVDGEPGGDPDSHHPDARRELPQRGGIVGLNRHDDVRAVQCPHLLMGRDRHVETEPLSGVPIALEHFDGVNHLERGPRAAEAVREVCVLADRDHGTILAQRLPRRAAGRLPAREV